LRWADVEKVAQQLPASPRQAGWTDFIIHTDHEVRARVQRGAEDTVSSMALYGTTFTLMPRLKSPDAALTSDRSLSPAAQARVRALAEALAGTPKQERLLWAQSVLHLHGHDKDRVEAELTANLVRFAKEQRGYEQKLSQASDAADPGVLASARSTLYAGSGLRVETSLLPNLGIEDTLRTLVAKRSAPKRVRRIAVVGPGLDIVDRSSGYDFYPLQTLQPYAVLEAAARLELGSLDEMRLTAFDLNAGVLDHLTRASAEARSGKPRLLALVRDPDAGWNDAAVAYWRSFGGLAGRPLNDWLGKKVPPGLELRTVAIRPEVVSRISAQDLNVIAQTEDDPEGERYDLVVATNILLYYEPFLQTIGLASISHLLNAGGVFLSNTVLPPQHPPGVEFLGRRTVTYGSGSESADDIVAYRRRTV
jgi:hypothetical protein